VRALREAISPDGDEVQTHFAHGVFALVESGLDATLGAERLTIAPADLGPDAPRVSVKQGLTVQGAPLPIEYMPGSRNWSERYGTPVDRIVIHTTEGVGSGNISYLLSNTRQVSAHYLVMRSGAVYQFVPEEKKAWHAGCWNARSVGIEHEGFAGNRNPYTGAAVPFTDETYRSSARLVSWIADKWGIPKDRAHIVGHGDPELKNCNDHWDPGPHWDWARFLALVNEGNPATYNPVGHLDTASCDVVAGWTCDRDDFARGLDVHVYANGAMVASGQATLSREPAVAALCGGAGAHGFRIQLPVSLRDGQAKALTAYAINVGRGTGNPALAGSGVSITCQPQPAHATGRPLTGAITALATNQRFTPMAPLRQLDTRTGFGLVGANQPLSVVLSGLPAQTSAVATNLAVVNPGAAGYGVVGLSMEVSSVNFAANTIVSAATFAPVSAGRLSLVSTAPTHLVADVTGAFGPTGAGLVAAPYRRVLDTRQSLALTENEERRVELGGLVPPGAVAAMVNLAVTQPQRGGWLAAYPCGGFRGTSSLNYAAGQTVATHSTVALSGSALCVRSSAATHLVVDLGSAFVNGQGSGFTVLTPTRVLDTRRADGAITGRLEAGRELRIPFETLPGLPATGAVSVTLTVVHPAAGGFVSAGPCGALDGHSNLNFAADDVARANQAVVPLAGGVCVRSTAATDLVIDLTGVFP
jgi:N-acetyl-anhydromuramyl-L-alanine amidase AmpD